MNDQKYFSLSLAHLLIGISIICVVLAITADESAQVASAMVALLLCQSAIVVLATIIGQRLREIMSQTIEVSSIVPIVRAYRLVPTIALTATILLVALSLSNYILDSGTKRVAQAAIWGWVLLPIGMLVWTAVKRRIRKQRIGSSLNN